MTFKLDVLGANATAPDSAGAASGYVLTGETGVVVVDAGPGSMMAYMEKYDLEQLRGIIVTHMHADHSIDLMTWAYKWTFPTVKPQIPLYLPAGEVAKLAAYDDLYGIPTLPTMKRPITGTFDVREMPLDGTTEHMIDGIAWRAFEARHAIPSASLRLERGGRTITFSSDTGECPGLIEAAKGADVFVCEATYLDPNPEAMATHGHLTPVLAGKIARDAGVGKLVLTHLSFSSDAKESSRRAKETFGKDVQVARPGLEMCI